MRTTSVRCKAGPDIPDLDPAIAATRQEQLAVRAEREGACYFGVAGQHRQGACAASSVSRARVPQSDEVVIAGRRDQVAVG